MLTETDNEPSYTFWKPDQHVTSRSYPSSTHREVMVFIKCILASLVAFTVENYYSYISSNSFR